MVIEQNDRDYSPRMQCLAMYELNITKLWLWICTTYHQNGSPWIALCLDVETIGVGANLQFCIFVQIKRSEIYLCWDNMKFPDLLFLVSSIPRKKWRSPTSFNLNLAPNVSMRFSIFCFDDLVMIISSMYTKRNKQWLSP